MFLKNVAIAGAIAGLMGSAAYAADCGPSGKSVRILGSDFPAIQAVAGAAEANCAGNAGEFTINLRDNTRDMMNQADVTTSEKYRRVMEAYQGELEYGRTTEAYSEALPSTGQTVEFLRVGRTLLVYQTSDQVTTGWFNPTTRTYEELPNKYRLEVKEGLAIARNEKAPNLVMLPVPGPEVVR